MATLEKRARGVGEFAKVGLRDFTRSLASVRLAFNPRFYPKISSEMNFENFNQGPG